jgi:periplasmic divalent cation tolerance protein
MLFHGVANAKPARQETVMTDAIVVLITAPGADKAAEIGRALVEERLAACANIVPGVRSIYRWEGKLQDDAEVLMLVKTRAALFEKLRERVVALHPYSVPEVLALPVAAGAQPYLDWIASATS